jgi:MoxR-like ATPase
VRLVLATRDPARYGVPEIAGQLEYGASPRASLGLVRAARALALLRGRERATPQDVYDVAYDVLNLRLVLSYRALAEGVTIDDVLVRLLRTVPAPADPGAWRAAPLATAITDQVAPAVAPAAPVWTMDPPTTPVPVAQPAPPAVPQPGSAPATPGA